MNPAEEFKPLIRDKEQLENASTIGIVPSSLIEIYFLKGEEENVITTRAQEYGQLLEGIVNKAGFNAYLPPDSFTPFIDGLPFANAPTEQARHIINMLNNPDIDAMVAIQGGQVAIEVAHLLDRYDKDWDGTQKLIEEAWKENHPGETLPHDFFIPRLEDPLYRDSDNNEHGLPKRGIPFIGFSDNSLLHHLLGQRGVVRSYYANNLHQFNEEEAVVDLLSGELNEIEYTGLIVGNECPLPSKPLPVYATLLERVSVTSGTPFQTRRDGCPIT